MKRFYNSPKNRRGGEAIPSNGVCSSFLKLAVFTIILVQVLIPPVLEAQSLSRNVLPNNRQLEQRAASLARLGKTEQAVDLYLELLYKNPHNSNIYFRVANLMPGKAYASTLLQILDDLLKSQSNNMRLAAERGRLLYLLDQKPEAIEEWKNLIERRGKDRFAYTSITNSMIQVGATDEAIQILLDGRLKLNESHAFAYDLARIYGAKFNYAAAGKEYLHHLDRNSAMLDHITNQLIRLLENEGAFELIEQNFEEILLTEGDHQAIVLSRAKLLLHEKQYIGCVQVVLSSDVRNSLKDVMSIADDLSAERAWGPAADLYLYISANSKDKRQAGESLLKLAATYEHRLQTKETYKSLSGYFSGNQFLKLDIQFTDGADASLERTLKLYDSLQTLLPRTQQAFKASYHISEIQLTVSGDVDRAIRGFQNIFDGARDKKLRLKSGKRLVDAWLVRGDTTTALKTLENIVRVLNLDEDDSQIIASRIKILIHQGDTPALKKELLNLQGAASPANPIFNDGLELSALIEGNGELDDPQLLMYLRAEQLIGQHKLSEAIDLLLRIKGDDTSIADEATIRAIQLLLALDKIPRAIEEMDRFLETFDESNWRANVLIWRGEQLQFNDHNSQAAIPYYEKVIIEHPGYIGIQDVRVRLRQIIGAG